MSSPRKREPSKRKRFDFSMMSSEYWMPRIRGDDGRKFLQDRNPYCQA
jgi:hypothetical protein